MKVFPYPFVAGIIAHILRRSIKTSCRAANVRRRSAHFSPSVARSEVNHGGRGPFATGNGEFSHKSHRSGPSCFNVLHAVCDYVEPT